MEKVKLTKEEFIRRSMQGEKFKFKGHTYWYNKDVKDGNPFRLNAIELAGAWTSINGENEFEVIKSTKILKEWMFANINGDWIIHNVLLTDEQAGKLFYIDEYKPTGREFEIEDN